MWLNSLEHKFYFNINKSNNFFILKSGKFHNFFMGIIRFDILSGLICVIFG